MRKMILVTVTIAITFLLFQFVRHRQFETPATLTKTMANAKSVNDRRIAVLALFDNHLAEACYTISPDLSPVRNLADAAVSDPSPEVRATAMDSIRRIVDGTNITAATGISPEKISEMQDNRVENRKRAAAILIDAWIAGNKIKVLEESVSNNNHGELAVQTRNVLYCLLKFDSDGKFKSVLSADSHAELKAWAEPHDNGKVPESITPVDKSPDAPQKTKVESNF